MDPENRTNFGRIRFANDERDIQDATFDQPAFRRQGRNEIENRRFVNVEYVERSFKQIASSRQKQLHSTTSFGTDERVVECTLLIVF